MVGGVCGAFAEGVGAGGCVGRVVANRRELEGEALSGKVVDPIVTAETKESVLLAECQGLRIEPARAIALGDGANDIAMIRAAGLGVAYRGKPITQEAADLAIDHLRDLIPYLSQEDG